MLLVCDQNQVSVSRTETTKYQVLVLVLVSFFFSYNFARYNFLTLSDSRTCFPQIEFDFNHSFGKFRYQLKIYGQL